MKVTFAEFDSRIASTRLRATIPKLELEKVGIKQGRDVLVYGKHFASMDQVKKYGRVIFDICDNHFKTKSLSDYYRGHAANADLLTVNSSEMARIVLEETGRDAFIIPDPYESDEREASIGEYPLWFGHESNLKDVEPYGHIRGLKVLTGDNWSREKQLEMLGECSCVLIPTGKSMAKSANRLIESVRNGRFVVAGEMPAHEEFKKFMWVGINLDNGIQWLYSNPSEALQRIRDCQAYIRDRYSPLTISKLWLEAIGRVWHTPTAH